MSKGKGPHGHASAADQARRREHETEVNECQRDGCDYSAAGVPSTECPSGETGMHDLRPAQG